MNDPVTWELPLYRGGNRYSQRLIEQSEVIDSKWGFGSKSTWFPQVHTVSKYFLVYSINLSIYNCINLPMVGEQSFPPFPYSEILKVWMLLYGSLYRQEKKGMTEDEVVGWHPRLNGHKFEQTRVVGDGPWGLVYCSPWGRKESDMTEWLNWIKLIGFSTQLFLSITQQAD